MSLGIVVSSLMPCPACGCTATVQGSAPVGIVEPAEPGDLAICIGCEAICVLSIDGQLRLFADDDLDYYSLDAIARISRAATELRRAYRWRN